ncbi:MAG TPA: 1-deoxy-D-xylulose-5-phosphate reductoisomerase [Burkholderiales bacterium]|jgi:1-deoxy-D-xylulose-5-phosphate reductoisomerase|nr:1-deoxy-D-xylulose-5-phosphate reductoisomerase [Burkholderiales bacterium]
MSQPRQLAILGSTGSIGVNTLDVVSRHRGRFKVIALSAHRQVDLLLRQCIEFQPVYAVIESAHDAEVLKDSLRAHGAATTVLHGERALADIASLPQVDTVMAAIVGIAGLRASFAAVQAGKRVLLANKEALVTAGPVFMQAVRAHGATLLPIDSEHNAVFQALPRGFAGDLEASGVRRIILTASGGPFRNLPLERLDKVTPDEACAHPNWVMGRKISVDSATMMNKGLEIIEASWLFNADESRIDVVIHPESVIHSLVEYVDGSLLAQLGNPDMRTPIAFALGYPDRIEAGVEGLDLALLSQLNFAAPDSARFPCLELARAALRAGGSAPAVLNAANEVAVAAFLDSTLAFSRIPELIADALAAVPVAPLQKIEDVYAADQAARGFAHAWLSRNAAAKQKSPVSA